MRRATRIASVGFVNARPLIEGLERESDLALQLEVPSALPQLLRSGQADVALLPTVELQRVEDVVIVPVGGIGCNGATLTVRIFSQTPLEQVTTLACDPDSRTSVALARVIFAERFGTSPEFIPLRQARGGRGEARLLIGDKVVCEEPVGFEHQLDLGQAWKDLTGLPFVFAVWAARGDVGLGDLPGRLTEARERGMDAIEAIIKKHAVPRGWPTGIAWQYLTSYLKFEIAEPQLSAIAHFHYLAGKHGVLEVMPRDIPVFGDHAPICPAEQVAPLRKTASSA